MTVNEMKKQKEKAAIRGALAPIVGRFDAEDVIEVLAELVRAQAQACPRESMLFGIDRHSELKTIADNLDCLSTLDSFRKVG